MLTRRGFFGTLAAAAGAFSVARIFPITPQREDLDDAMRRAGRTMYGGRFYLSRDFVLRPGDHISHADIDVRGFSIDGRHDGPWSFHDNMIRNSAQTAGYVGALFLG